MHSKIPLLFDCWANQAAHLLLIKSSMAKLSASSSTVEGNPKLQPEQKLVLFCLSGYSAIKPFSRICQSLIIKATFL